ncbi:hypothetical protein [Pseudoalteromonas rubra]|uniref:hypothetical protein n=1 Tax=Pseudoalteromonas rubra TaxID=43658 RepID=UPI002DBFAAE1|nr:hypothetical protein [Pseudoalteromonas rubra]MEC4091935.1 hypothetical protein [Pseudoalteromonas rubra]
MKKPKKRLNLGHKTAGLCSFFAKFRTLFFAVYGKRQGSSMLMKYFLILLLLPVTVLAEDCSGINSCNYTSMWSQYSKFEVTYSNSEKEKGTTFEYFIDNNESLMTFETKNGRAYVYTIPKVATLWKGVGETGIKSAKECRAVVKDTHAIIQSYAVRPLFFLGYGTKLSPEQLGKENIIEISNNEDTRVQINPGDHMVIGGPWKLEGTILKDKYVKYSISHEYKGKNGKNSSLHLKGEWVSQPHSIPIDAKESLDEWLVCIWGSYSYKDGKSIFTPNFSETSKLTTISDIKTLASAL